MKKILLLSFLFAATMLSAQKPVELPLWPNGAPNNNELTNSGQNHNNEWVSDVTTPTLTVYPASHPNGMAIIMCPGGGYGGLAMKHEGHDMAPWFNTQGITYAVLKYRMPNGHHEVPLSDAEQAPADMAGDSGTTSPTSVNGRKNWRSGCVKGSYSRSLNLPQRNKSNYE